VASRSAKPTRVNAARPASEHGDGWRGPSRSREVPGQSTSPQRRHCSVSRYQHVALGRHVAVRLGGPVLARGRHTAACREKQQPRARFTPANEPTGPFEGVAIQALCVVFITEPDDHLLSELAYGSQVDQRLVIGSRGKPRVARPARRNRPLRCHGGGGRLDESGYRGHRGSPASTRGRPWVSRVGMPRSRSLFSTVVWLTPRCWPTRSSDQPRL
jgi:hypothetical protein